MSKVSLENQTISFRHPLLESKDGYGRVIRRGLAREHPDGTLQRQIQGDLEKLVVGRVVLRSDPIAEGCCDQALGLYFDPLHEQAEARRNNRREDVKRDVLTRKIAHLLLPGKTVLFDKLVPTSMIEELAKKIGVLASDHYADEIMDLQDQLNTEQAEKKRLQNERDGMIREVGSRSHQASTITLEDCVAHWKRHIICKSERARADVFRRVDAVLAEIEIRTDEGVLISKGINSKHCEVTQKSLTDAVTRLVKDRGATEHKYKLRDAKRFFRDVSLPTMANGLGLQNPAAGIKPGTPKIGAKETLDAKKICKNKRLSAYWRMLAASMGYAGCRLSEAARLEWDMIDEKKQIINLKPTRYYPEFKNLISPRVIRPFKQFWTIYREYKRQARHEVVLFDRPREKPPTVGDKDNPTWFEMRDDKLTAGITLPGVFSEALELAGMKSPEPSRRLRRWWETRMRSKGLGHLIEHMGGHSDEVGLRSYANDAEIVRAQKAIGKA